MPLCHAIALSQAWTSLVSFSQPTIWATYKVITYILCFLFSSTNITVFLHGGMAMYGFRTLLLELGIVWPSWSLRILAGEELLGSSRGGSTRINWTEKSGPDCWTASWLEDTFWLFFASLGGFGLETCWERVFYGIFTKAAMTKQPPRKISMAPCREVEQLVCKDILTTCCKSDIVT